MIIFSIILALLIAKRVSRPIEELNDSTKKLAIGDYNVKFDASGYKEIKELSKTLTYTASELSKVDRLKNELIANISHDLRTPLTLISGYAEAMRDLPNESTPENAQIIVDEAQRLTTLVNDVLDISKIQAGKEVLNVAPFNLTEMINTAIKRMREMVKNLGYKIEFEYDKQVNVIADETKIYQAFYNLLINAINYTGFDKIVEVHQIVEGDTVKIEVKDTGEGVSEENLPYIWDRYYKIEKTHKRAVAGTGIGLSIVKSVIEMHGGKYGVVSKTNEGSTFWFSLNIKN
jgi:signal transduction histidine kinase